MLTKKIGVVGTSCLFSRHSAEYVVPMHRALLSMHELVCLWMTRPVDGKRGSYGNQFNEESIALCGRIEEASGSRMWRLAGFKTLYYSFKVRPITMAKCRTSF